ncbi:N-acetylgalactosamine-6-sulfatase-like isoform X2 [Corticium candelabrum]|nr:N-acetylgalactosamine-6-sulfatase-like isoform X2 [Corticium candelabrum]
MYRNDEMVGRIYEEFEINKKTGESNITQLYKLEAIDFIHKQVKADQPFFLLWAPDATHEPLFASEPFLGTSQRGLYGDAVRELDSCVGEIVDMLHEAGVMNNTLVFFSSDNGGATYAKTKGGSNGPLLCGKETTYEGGTREPTIAYWPGTINEEQVSHQLGSLMDWFSTALDLAGVEAPGDKIIDGISLSATLQKGEIKNRPIFYYRGDEMMAVRVGMYKAHYWTWTESLELFNRGTDFCPGEDIPNVTTHDQVNNTAQPLLFHLGRDPGEKYIIHPLSSEYNQAIDPIRAAVAEHLQAMKRADPQLNYCDPAVMNWAPSGCQKLNKCLPIPSHHKTLCVWDH